MEVVIVVMVLSIHFSKTVPPVHKIRDRSGVIVIDLLIIGYRKITHVVVVVFGIHFSK